MIMPMWIFELANNHDGSVEHAKLIIDEFANVRDEMALNAAIKFQFRQLDTFVHKDFVGSPTKHIKRFFGTRLNKSQFAEIIDYATRARFQIIATPFDNESLPWITDLGVDIIKIASCSIDDWPLLKEACLLRKPMILSSAAAPLHVLKRAVSFAMVASRNVALLHCVGEYPTSPDCANLSRILLLQHEFPDVHIGISTHESPNEKSIVPLAVAMGCTVIEKHVGVQGSGHTLNAYSCAPDDIRKLAADVAFVESALVGQPNEEEELASLRSLKRGIYMKKTRMPGDTITESDVYFAMPCQTNQLDTSKIDCIIGKLATEPMEKDTQVTLSVYDLIEKNTLVNGYASWLKTAAGILDNDKIIACGSFPIVEDNASWVQKTWEFNYTTVEKEKKVDYLATMNLFVKKEYFLKVNGFDELLRNVQQLTLDYTLALSRKKNREASRKRLGQKLR